MLPLFHSRFVTAARSLVWILTGVAGLGVGSCTHLEPSPIADNQTLDGPVEGLSAAELQQFRAGDFAFNNEIFTPETGLGPGFVATSCGSCHAGDGKGHPFTALTRFGQTDSTGNAYLTHGGPQLQHRSIPGFEPETLPQGAASSVFLPPASSGLGFLEAVPDADLLAMTDPNDADGDGISGVANWVHLPDYVQPSPQAISRNGRYIGRFGKKAAVYNLLQQTANAYNQDMGITSEFEPFDTYTHQRIDPEVSTKTLQNVVFYMHTLKAPIPRNTGAADVQLGKQTFLNIGCEGCHKQTLKTGPSPISALSEIEFHPYTDLLLHDMGPNLNDGYTEGNALPQEWRTPPLWGLGLSPRSQGNRYFLLHDGRAHSIEEAIRMHGGEAAASARKFAELPASDQQNLISFLKSL